MPDGSLRVTAQTVLPKTCNPHSGKQKVYHRPLILIAMAFAVGIFVGGTWPGYGPIVTAAGCLTAARICYTLIRHRRSLIAPIILLVLLGYSLIGPWLSVDFPEDHIIHYTDSQSWHIEGNVTNVLPARHGRTRLVLWVTELHGGNQTLAVRGQIRVTVSEEISHMVQGTRLAFKSRIRSFRNFNNPGGFDYRRHMAFQRVFGSAFVNANRLKIVEKEEATNRDSMISKFRVQAGMAIEQLPDIHTQAIMKALLIGDREAISPDLRRMFNRCGVGHLLAISGLHIGIVGGLVFWVFQWGLNWVPFIIDRGWGRRGATMMSVGPIVIYAILAGLSPATQRALIMVLAFMTTYFVYRDGDTLNFLALAAILMLLWFPPAMFSISFQLSFVAVFWIILGLSARKAVPVLALDWRAKLGNRIKIFMQVTFWATVGTLPLAMLYFQEVSLIGLLVNCLLVPSVGFFVLPVGLLSIFILPMNGYVADFGIQIAGWGLSQALHLLQVLNALDGVAVKTFVPSSLEIIAYYGLLGLVAMRRVIRPARWFFLCVLAVFVADGLYWGYERFWHRDLRVTVIDVGQGSAALVEFPGGKTMLIDGGGYTNNRFFDVGERILAPFLRYRKIMQIDTIVLSHPSSDHMNGLVYILAHFSPKRLLWTGDRASTESFRTFLKEVVLSGVQVPAFIDIEREVDVNGVKMEVLHPLVVSTRRNYNLSGKEYNNNSIVLKLTMGACGILFPGDIEALAEEGLVGCCRPELLSRVLVAPHHGSKTSSSMEFLEAVRPEIIIISAGWQNRFGFPHTSVLERYKSLAPRVYRTDGSGAVRLRTDGRQWLVNTQ